MTMMMKRKSFPHHTMFVTRTDVINNHLSDIYPRLITVLFSIPGTPREE